MCPRRGGGGSAAHAWQKAWPQGVHVGFDRTPLHSLHPNPLSRILLIASLPHLPFPPRSSAPRFLRCEDTHAPQGWGFSGFTALRLGGAGSAPPPAQGWLAGEGAP